MFGSFITFTILRILPVFEILKNSYKIPGIGITRKFELFWDYSFLSFFNISRAEQFLVLALSTLTTLNIILFIIFARRQQQMLLKRSFVASLSGMFFGLFGVGCLSCGVLILAPLVTFLGLGAHLANFAQHAITISYIGMVLVIISSLYLLKKISDPLVCTSE